ncbi:DNA-(apurinic or apyrimidinic site) lyase, putative [Eimeria brunetti]|uniref:DNA-(Apurinic or apyrimidinic site) lyase, putative n=1 Tax=Eimeria brunetti TaxID=51314 RepID=U6LI73_9EIME|nr:DNA-(apurinic or apyrimidinic site) lyase, putative [Eimeria brunetti]
MDVLSAATKRGGGSQKMQRTLDSFSQCKQQISKETSFSSSSFPSFSSSEAFRSSVLQLGPRGPLDPLPLSFLTWNVNGLLPRVKASQWTQFADYIKDVRPDVICLQEIRLPALGPPGCRKNDGQQRERGAVRVELPAAAAAAAEEAAAAATATAAEKREIQTIAASLREAIKALPEDYHILMSLADWKYSGKP